VGIVGHHPESGVRIAVERSRADGPPWSYEGEAVTPSARFRVSVMVEADGAVQIRLPTEAPTGLAEKARLIVRTAWRHACDEAAAAPPRRIVRWRADR
jgi:hypothetical protein